MIAEPVPAGTTLIIRGGRAILPDGDWHAPPEVDIAIAGGEIAGIAPRLATLAGASRPARIYQRALPLPRCSGQRHARGGPARELASLCPAAAISAALRGGGTCAHFAGGFGMPSFRDHHDPGHAHPLSVRGPAPRRGHAGLRAGRHPGHLQPAICRSAGPGDDSLLGGDVSEGAACAPFRRGRAGTAALPPRPLRNGMPAAAATRAGELGARSVGARALLPCADGAHHGT